MNIFKLLPFCSIIRLKKTLKLLPLMKMCSNRFLDMLDQNLDREINVTKYIFSSEHCKICNKFREFIC